MEEKNNYLLSNLRKANELEELVIANGGEISDEIDELLTLNDLAIRNAVDSYAFVIESMKERARYWKEKAALLSKYARTCSLVSDRLKGNLKNCMIAEGRNEVPGEDVRFTLQPVRGSLEIDESLLPLEYVDIETVRTVNKDKIRKALAEGKDVPGATILESYSLRSYPMHSKSKRSKGE